MAIRMSGSRDDSKAGNFCVLFNFFGILLNGFSFSLNRSIVTELNAEAFSTDERRVGIGAAVVVVVLIVVDEVVVVVVVVALVVFVGGAVDRIEMIPFELFVGAINSPFFSVETLKWDGGRGEDDACGSD